MKGFYILEPPLPLWRLFTSVLGAVCICASIRNIIKLRGIPYKYREWILHTIWSMTMIWLYVFMLHKTLLYTWKWVCISWLITDALWVSEHRAAFIKSYGLNTFTIRLWISTCFIVFLFGYGTPSILFATNVIIILMSMCLVIVL